MPIDYQREVYTAWLTLIQAGVTAYNVAGKPPARVVLDDRSDGRVREGLIKGSADSYPQVRLKLAGGNFPKTKTPTFALAAGAPCDAIFNKTITLEEVVTHDAAANDLQTPLEAAIDAQIDASPKLGLTYCSGFSARFTRRDERIGGDMRTVRRRTIEVSLVTHLIDSL